MNKKIKKFIIEERYSDLCFFKKKTIVFAENEEEAEHLYRTSDEEFEVISDEMFDQKNDYNWNEIEGITEVKE